MLLDGALIFQVRYLYTWLDVVKNLYVYISLIMCIYICVYMYIWAVRIWSYAKTPARGVKSFQMLLDGALIFQLGSLSLCMCVYL